MKSFLHVVLVISLLFATSSATMISPGKAVSHFSVEDSVKISDSDTKFIRNLTKKELRRMSSTDMEKMLGREMTNKEKTAFKLNKKRFVEYSQLAEV